MATTTASAVVLIVATMLVVVGVGLARQIGSDRMGVAVLWCTAILLAVAGLLTLIGGRMPFALIAQASGWWVLLLLVASWRPRPFRRSSFIGFVALGGVLGAITATASEAARASFHLAAAASSAGVALCLWLGAGAGGRRRSALIAGLAIGVLVLGSIATVFNALVAASASYGIAGIALLAAIGERRAGVLEQQAMVDELTGLANLRAFRIAGAQWLASLRRRAAAGGGGAAGAGGVVLLLFDLDGFKQVNDRFGHGAGDRVLIEFGSMLTKQVRLEDLVARIGGDEFVVLLGGIDVAGAERIAARIDRAAERLRPTGAAGGVSVSRGATELRRDDATLADALARADAALYRAKSARPPTAD